MKKFILLLSVFVAICNSLLGQEYPINFNEYGFSVGALQRHYGNVDQGRSENGYTTYRFAFDVQPRANFLLGGFKSTVEIGTHYQDIFFNQSVGAGLALFKSKNVRLDAIIYAGIDFSKSIDVTFCRPTLSSNISAYYKNFRISYAVRVSGGWVESYGEGGITIGYFLRRPPS